jgi:hypothetical protein
VTAAGLAINAQLKADETRLRAKKKGDVLERLIKRIEEVKRQYPEILNSPRDPALLPAAAASAVTPQQSPAPDEDQPVG